MGMTGSAAHKFRLVNVSFLLLLTVAGCSTAPVQPRITDFSQSVEALTGVALERYQAEDVAPLYRAELDAAVAGQNALLDMAGCDRPIGISVALDDPALRDFSRHCALVTVRRDDPTVPVAVRPADGQPGVMGENARRLALALRDYAGALSRLATADNPQQLGESFAAASTSLIALGSEASKVRDGAPLSAERQAAARAGASLLQTALVTAFEVRRYRLLANIVDAADDDVAVASRALAAWYFELDRDDVLGRYDDLHAAMAAYQEAAATGAAAQTPLAAAAREAYEAVVAAEAAAAWKPFLGIAESHRLLREAMQAPADFARLAEVNARIDQLVEQAKAFIAAVDAAADNT